MARRLLHTPPLQKRMHHSLDGPQYKFEFFLPNRNGMPECKPDQEWFSYSIANPRHAFTLASPFITHFPGYTRMHFCNPRTLDTTQNYNCTKIRDRKKAICRGQHHQCIVDCTWMHCTNHKITNGNFYESSDGMR